MFALKKIIVHFLLPPGIFIAILVVASLFFLFKKQWKAAIVCFFVAASMWLLSIVPVSDFLLRGLESGHKIPSDPEGDVIVILGGGSYEGAPDMSGIGRLTEETMGRVVTAFRLQKKLRLPVIVSGGVVFKGTKADAPFMKRLLVDLGVPDKSVIMEEKSRDTYENAKYVKKLCEKMKFKKPLVVTSALHMSRSVMSFEKVGMEVIPFPANFKTWADRKYIWEDYLPADFRYASAAIHEYLGLIFYKFAY